MGDEESMHDDDLDDLDDLDEAQDDPSLGKNPTNLMTRCMTLTIQKRV